MARVHNIEDREGFRVILLDDSTKYTTIRDFKEEKEQIENGDFIAVWGTCKTASKFENVLQIFNVLIYVEIQQVVSCETSFLKLDIVLCGCLQNGFLFYFYLCLLS